MKQRLTQAPYDRKQVGQDLSSGGIAAMSMLPFALAFGALAGIGMPAGLIAAVGASLVTALVPGRVPYFAGPVCIVFLVFSACAKGSIDIAAIPPEERSCPTCFLS